MTRLGVGAALVGRQTEVAALVAALDRAAAGTPAGVLLSGDAGVGKSRLVAEAAARASTAGVTVLTGRCLDAAESALPYLPFTDIVGALPPELVARHVALRHLLPGGVPREEAGGRELGQLRVFDAVLSVLDELTATSPALVVVEDLHWADRSSRDLLTFLLSRLDAQRLVLLATYRSDDLHRRHPLRPVLAELVRLPAVERIELEPLGEADALALVRELAAGTMAPPLLHNVARRSEGNAFFAEELVAACSDGLPHSLVEVLLSRVEGLSAGTQRLLRVAAVAGTHVHHDQLAVVSGLDVEELEQALREAVNHHVLVPGSAVRDGYTFRHALLREAVHHDLLPGERSRLHSAFATLLADPATTDEPGRAARLAHHALSAHDLPGALAASVQAAREADDREAPAELLLHTERALELWPAVPDAETVAGEPEYRLTRLAAYAASATGDPDRGTALGRRALQLAERRGDPVLTADMRLRYALRLMERGDDHAEARAAAEQALEVFGSGPPSGDLAWCHAVLARTHYRVDDFAEAVRSAEAALAVARDVPDTDDDTQAAAADALVTLANCDQYGGRPERARARTAEARGLASRVGHLGAELRAYYAIGLSLLEDCQFLAAAAELAAGEERAAATGLRWSVFGLDVRVGHVVARFLAGEWDAAEDAADLAGAAVPATVSARLVTAGLLVAAARGRFDVVERRYSELIREPQESLHAVLYLGLAAAEAALWQGRPADALDRAAQARAALGVIEPLSLGGIALAALGIAALADRVAAGSDPAGSAAEACTALATAEKTAETGLPRGTEMGPEGRAWLVRARAELTRLTGPDPAAWDAVVDAFAFEPGPGLGYRGAYAALRRAEARLACGGHDVADDLGAAHATATRLRAAPLLAAVTAMATRAGVPVGGSRPSSQLLTPRERSVLEQVAHGLTNRQAGAALFISEKTISVHLSRVMAKLGAGSRTEAVALAYQRGLLTPRVSP